MSTTKELVESSLRVIGVLADGEEATPSQVQDALVSAKYMLDSWSNEGLMIGAITHEEFTLENKRTHTIGPAGDFNTVRPMEILSARYRDPSGHEQPVQIVTHNVWAGISFKDDEVDFPPYIYYEPSYPLGVLHSSAINTAGYGLIIDSLKQLADLPELTAEMDFQPGFMRAIKYGLAIELADEYGREIKQATAAKFKAAIINLKRTNSKGRANTLMVDNALLTSGGSTTNNVNSVG